VPRKKDKPFLDAVQLSLEKWLEYVEIPEEKRPARIACYNFPTDRHFHQYLETIKARSEREVKLLLRNFLPMGGSFGVDRLRLKDYLGLPPEEFAQLFDEFEYVKRLFEGTAGNKRHVWEGLSWVIDLLPRFPAQAIAAIEAYNLSHYFILPDGRVSSLSDAVALIRAKFLEAVTEQNVADVIPPRDFEFLVASIYMGTGYEVQVTQQTRDGGHDIVAIKETEGSTERLLIQCKRVHSAVPVTVARELMGTLDVYSATRGVLICTSKFTAPTTAFAKRTARLELVHYGELCKKLNAAHGTDWPSYVSKIVVSTRAKIAK
jgi:restriction system protein